MNLESTAETVKPQKKIKVWMILVAILAISYLLSLITKCTYDPYEAVKDEYLKNDLINALSEMQVDKSEVSDFEKIDNWAGGERYSFTYSNKITLTVYCNMSSTIDSINYGEIKLYYRGYETYNVNDYIFNEAYRLDLQIKSEDIVSLYLNYPATAKFSSSYWTSARYDNIYYLASTVEAANAFGVYSTYNFKIAYHVVEEGDSWKYKAVYLSLGGKVQFNYLDDYVSKEERKTVEPKYPLKNATTTVGIHLQYASLGEYGKEEIVDGETYIFYCIPSGKYLVTNHGNMGTIFVASDEMKKNSSGYLESVDQKVYTFKTGSNGATMEIEVPEKYHIELSMQTNINLQKIDE